MIARTSLTLLMGLSLTVSAHAANWVGTGELFDAHGVKTADYTLDVVITELGSGKSESVVKVTLPDGTQRIYRSESTHSSAGWSTTGDHGNGGGHCFGAQNDLCQSY